jgi:hypothetical protein
MYDLSECKKGNHKLVVIDGYSVGYGAENVIRWCVECGSVVVDVDVDNRHRHLPGGVMKMITPNVCKYREE